MVNSLIVLGYYYECLSVVRLDVLGCLWASLRQPVGMSFVVFR